MEPSILSDKQLFVLSNAHQQNVFYIKTQDMSLDDDDDGTLTNKGTLGCQSVDLDEDQAANSPFTCVVGSSDKDVDSLLHKVFDVSSFYKGGRPVCSFRTKDSSDEFRKSLSVRPDYMVDVSVILHDSSSGTEFQSPVKINMKFTPDVFLAATQLTLSKNQPSATIDVIGSSSRLTSLKVCLLSM